MSLILDCWILDDEPLALSLLESYVNNTPFLKLTGKFSSAKSAMLEMTNRQPDVIFLDIQMPFVNGMEFARLVNEKTKIIFITAFKEYALESYRVNAVDYLLKPVSYANFLSAAKKALTWHETAQAKETMLHAPKRRDDGIFVKSDYKIVHLFFGDILYVEGLKNYVKIFTQKHPKPIITLMPMKEIEDMLPKEAFIRVHRSFIVCKNKIESINKNRLWIGGREISIGQTYKDGFIKEFLPRSV